MRRVFVRFVTSAAVLASCGLALAAGSASEPKVDGGNTRVDQGVSSVTDANGNPIDTAASAAPERPGIRRATGGVSGPEVQRGQAWWPYPTPLGSYTTVGKSVESMSEDEIQINGVAILNVRDPQATLQRLPKDLVVGGGSQFEGDSGYYLVKIAGFSRTQEQIDALQAAGAILGEYLNVNTYIAKIPSSAVGSVRGLSFVTYVGDYQPAYKISPRLGLEKIPQDEAIDSVTGREKPWLLEVVLQKGANVNDVLGRLAGLSMFPAHDDVVVGGDDQVVVFARTAPDFIPMLAQVPGVKWIAEKTYPRLSASSTSPTVNPVLLQNNGVFTTNTLTAWKLWNAGIDGNASGTAQIVTLMDTGLNTSMEHFAQDTAAVGTIGPAHRKVVGYDVYGGGDQCVNNYTTADGGHGTSTSQHAVGSISNMTSNPDVLHTPTTYYDNGIAKDGKVYFQDIGIASGALSPPADLGPSITAAIAKGSFIQNHSWGAATPTYGSATSLLDTAIFNNPGMIVTVAAGNNGVFGTGTIDDLCTGKNVICVGGTDPGQPSSLFEDCTWDGAGGCGSNDLGSGRGPVSVSNRVKPDILGYMANRGAVGGEFEAEENAHAMCQTDAVKTVYWDWTNNSGTGGTSYSAPELAGLAALVRDYFQAGFYPTGTATPANAITPAGSLVKAILLASGEDMTTSTWPTVQLVAKRYSSDVGYGRANLPAALHIGSGAPFLWVQNGDSLGGGSTKSFFYNINGNATALRVMMTYYDTAGNALQKDVDLKVTIGGNVYLGNVFSLGWSTTGGAADHTNNTEGVFLDAAHGLPASGTIQVDVIGFNNPGGNTYSLAVIGDVASQAVTQVSLDQGVYACNDTIKVTVNDAAGSSPVSVTLTSRNALSTIIDTQVVSCAGSGGVFTGTITAGSGIVVADGGTVTATYLAVPPAVSTVDCKVAASDGGFLLAGGCDNTAAGTNLVTGPQFNGGSNEFYSRYMDAGEATAYTFGFVNRTGVPLTDVNVSLSFSGPGASKMTVLNNPVRIGSVPPDSLTGAVFQVLTDGTTTGLTSVNMDFDITSPADGYTSPRRLTQVQLLQTNDLVTRQASCSPFTTNTLAPWFESAVTGGVNNVWKSTLTATTPGTVGAELRVDGACGTNTANASVMVGNSATTSGNNFAQNADSFLLINFQPALRGNGPNGQPYRYTWKWHSFYHASELGGNTTGVWGAFYNNTWDSAVNPTGDQASDFPIQVCCYYQTIFDYPNPGSGGAWNWEALNTGSPDNPNLNSTTSPTSAPNQLFITFGSSISGFATNSTYFSYGHEHTDAAFYGVPTTATTRRDIALDNDRLVYDEYYSAAQAGASCTGAGQVGLVAFDRYSYDDCPSSTAVLSVTDANAVGPLNVTVTSPGTGDSETVSLTGTAPYFSGTLTLSTNSGGGANNGTLVVLPGETVAISYTDASPAGSSTSSAIIGCPGSSVVYFSNAQVSDNGDNDGIADNNETVTLDVTIKNNLPTSLTNAKVTIYSTSPNIDCVGDPTALYGTVAAGASATNPAGDRFKFHVNSSVACSDWQTPPTATFTVLISGDGVYGSGALQTFTINLDLDNQAPVPFNISQNFNSNPGWQTGSTADDDGTCTGFTNLFHWCAACGNAGGGYGAWVGNSAFGTSGQNYTALDSSTLYSPTWTAGTNVTLQFQVAYRTEPGYDGALVQYKLDNNAWANLAFTTPAQTTTQAAQDTCNPLALGVTAWNGTGSTWTTTNVATVPSTSGQTIQFRWRLGADSSIAGTTYGGLGVDNVTINNLVQTAVCEPNRNTGLPGCVPDCTSLPDGSACDDGNACTQNDACSGGVCVGTTPAPGLVDNGVLVNKTGSDANLTWNLAADSTTSDVLRGALSALPVGPGGGDETCFGGIVGTAVTDPAIPATGTGYWYLVRGHNACAGGGSYGTQGVNGAPGAARVSTTCP